MFVNITSTQHQHRLMPAYWIEKCLQGRYGQSHAKYGQTDYMQCACNALMAICWARVMSCWHFCDLDHVLDIEDDLYKTLGLHWYLDASDSPDQISLEGYHCLINKLYLLDVKVVIGRRFPLNLFQNMNAVLLFINSIVTAIICLSCAYYFFD